MISSKFSILNFVLAFIVFINKPLNAQEAGMPKIIPPSPAAISTLTANNSNNFYTGKLSTSIPLLQFSTKQFEIPISLNYTGGGGIKLEEIASWVGLGWGLTADYAVSRTINGFHDDKINGFLEMDSIPLVIQENAQLYQEYAQGIRDSEPDFFYYSLPSGEQGSFVFDLANNIKLKEKKNIKISYTRDANNLINSFVITGTDGAIYEFTNMEKTYSLTVNGPPLADLNYYANSWYLTKIVDHNRTDSIIYEYAQDSYSITNQVPVSEYVYNGGEEVKWTESYYQSSRLTKIKFNAGVIEFIPSTAGRKDIGCCMPYLDQIVMKNLKGYIVKTIKFNYSYFAKLRNFNLTENITSEGVRLKLDSINVFPGSVSAGQSQATSFQYYEDQRLPDRSSKSKDHWGFYNGKSNLKLEHKRIVKIKNLAEPWEIIETGEADRSPSFEHSKAYLLKKVIYPTKGVSTFTFEANRVNSNRWDVKQLVGTSVSNTSTQNLTTTTIVSKVVSPEIKVTLRCLIPEPDPSISPGQLVFRIKFTRQSDNLQYQFDYYSLTDPLSRADRFFFIKEGTYTVQLQTIYNPNNMIASFPISYYNELPCTNCEVGGVRLAMISNSNENGQVINRKYSYEDTIGVSSGYLSAIPEYGFYLINDLNMPYSYVSTINSSYPFTTTQGSFVGYGKVTETVDDLNSLGKTEYYFTTANDYPDSDRGNIYFDCDDWVTYDGVTMHRYPAPTIDTRDFLRGLLLKKIEYSKNSVGELIKIHQIDNVYDILKYNSCQTDHIPDENEAKSYLLQTPAFKGSWGIAYYIRYYSLYGGYAILKEAKETSYSGINTLLSKTTTDYGRNAFGFINSFLPKTVEVTTSKNQIVKTYFKYPIDFAGTSVYDNLINRNAIGTVIEKEIVNTSLNKSISKEKYNYDFFNASNKIFLKSVQKATNGNTLETIQEMEVYDSFGNICQTKSSNGITTSFLWGYSANYLVSKVIGASYGVVSALVNQNILNNPLTTDLQMRVELDKVRVGLASTMSTVTNYTYNPIIGITSITDLNGKSQFYFYDGYGRLILVKDYEGKILNQSTYNYSGQAYSSSIYFNSAKSGSYTRNNCSTGYSGSSVTYSVAADVYTSSISKALADEIAQNDVNANGQAYANATGTCVISCNTSNCTGAGKKCVFGNCETGIKVFTSSTWNASMNKWECIYHYEWSDGSWSQNYTQYSVMACPI